MRSQLMFAPLALLAVFATVCSDDDDDEPSPTPTSAAATVTPSPAPEVEATVAPTPTREPGMPYTGFEILGDFTYAEPVEFPENLMLLVETGCTQCDGPTEALYRIWRNAGETHVDKLIDGSIGGTENFYITSFALRPDLSDIVVSICTNCGGRNRPLTSSPGALYRSRDGGVTWTEIMTTVAGEWVRALAIDDNGIVLTDMEANLSYFEADDIEPPQGAEYLSYDSRRTGELRWIAAGGSEMLNSDGSTLAVVEPGGTIDALTIRRDWRIPSPVVAWLEDIAGPGFSGWYITRSREDWSLVGYRSDTYVAPVVILDGPGLLGIVSSPENPYGGTIGFIDLSEGVLTPIHGPLFREPFGNGERALGRNLLQAALEGSFLRVQVDSCLNVRTSATSQASVVDCLGDGVLVYDLGHTATGGGREWRQIRLFDGREGWSAGEYLVGE